MLPGARGQPDPASAEHAQHMPVGKQRHVAVSGARACDDPIRSRPALIRAFAARTAVAENQPTRPLLLDLGSGDSLVFPIVPLGEITLDDGSVAETRQFAGLPRALHRAHRTRANDSLASTGRMRSASRRPLSVSGISVVPVCWPLRLHAVSPCLIANTFMLAL